MPVTRRSGKPVTVKTQVVLLYAQGKSKTEIAKELNLDWHTVAAILKEAKIPDIESKSIESTFSKLGLTPEKVGTKLAELMDATETKRATFEGKFTDSAVDPDNSARFRATELTAKILQMLPQENASLVAQLFVRLPDAELVKGHGKLCKCEECCRAWESIPTAEVIEP